MGKLKNLLNSANQLLDAGWFSRILVLMQFGFVYWMLEWAMAFASTAIYAKADLMATAAVIAAVFVGPQALLMLATNKYMEMRGVRKEGNDIFRHGEV